MLKLRISAMTLVGTLAAGWGSPRVEVAETLVPPTLEQVCDPSLGSANLDFTLTEMHGGDVTLSDYSGNVVLLDFWATWCPPCRIEIPGFVELYDRYGADGFVPLGISIDDPVDRLHGFAEDLGMDYPVLVGDGRDDVKDAFGPLIGFPTTFLIGRDGRICSKHVGFAAKEEFEAAIRALL